MKHHTLVVIKCLKPAFDKDKNNLYCIHHKTFESAQKEFGFEHDGEERFAYGFVLSTKRKGLFDQIARTDNDVIYNLLMKPHMEGKETVDLLCRMDYDIEVVCLNKSNMYMYDDELIHFDELFMRMRIDTIDRIEFDASNKW